MIMWCMKGVAGNCKRTMPKALCLIVLPKGPREIASKILSNATCYNVQRVVENCNKKLKSNCRHNFLQATYHGYVEKVFMNFRHKLLRSENDEMFDLNINVLIWKLLMSMTMKSAIHLGLEYDDRKFIRNSEPIYFNMRFLSLGGVDSAWISRFW